MCCWKSFHSREHDRNKMYHEKQDPYLLVHDGAHQVLDSGQRHVTGLQIHRLSSQSNLQQEGHPMEGATGVSRAGDAVAAIG